MNLIARSSTCLIFYILLRGNMIYLAFPIISDLDIIVSLIIEFWLLEEFLISPVET